MAKRKFTIVLIKPSHYDDDGYVIQWRRSTIPSNSLASVYGLLLECAEARHQPIGREGVHRRHRQHRVVGLAQFREGSMQALEGCGDGRRQTPTGLRELDLLRQANEQRLSQPVLQHLDLVADGGLGHAEFFRRLGEALMPGRGLEGPDGGQRRQNRPEAGL